MNSSVKEDRIILQMQERSESRAVQSQTGEVQLDGEGAEIVIREAKRNFEGWQPNLGEVSSDLPRLLHR